MCIYVYRYRVTAQLSHYHMRSDLFVPYSFTDTQAHLHTAYRSLVSERGFASYNRSLKFKCESYWKPATNCQCAESKT
jgi:hypothetical protein